MELNQSYQPADTDNWAIANTTHPSDINNHDSDVFKDPKVECWIDTSTETLEIQESSWVIDKIIDILMNL